VSRAITLDPRVRVLDGGRTLLGGDPPRVLRVSDAGAAVVRALTGTGAAEDRSRGVDLSAPAARTLTRRLLDAGLAHPTPVRGSTAELTVVIPVRDRAATLARLLMALDAERPRRVLVVDDGSRDPAAVAAVCAGHGVQLVRRPRPGGPAAARNDALALVDGGLVALLDCDCVPEPGSLALLCGAIAGDERLGAVAPRIRPLGGHGTLARFAAHRSPLDLGPSPAAVRPGGRVAYVPTAALLARREALGSGFDPRLRYGEDVDLVWRMYDAGWRVRYVPAATVAHDEPATVRAWMTRRFHYGTAAGPLARRHPGRLAPAVVHPRPATVVALAGDGRPRAAAAVLALHVAVTTHRLSRHRVPPRDAAALALGATLETAVALGRAATMLAPAGLAIGVRRRRTRAFALACACGPPALAWGRARPRMDPISWTLLAIGDDVAYGAGVWTGAVRARTVAPLTPRVLVNVPSASDVRRLRDRIGHSVAARPKPADAWAVGPSRG
jgi:mycofactocin system glycosyltransferase